MVCMQSGATNSISRAMIEMGIPRETSLYLYDTIFFHLNRNEQDELCEEAIREKIKLNYNNLPYWIQVQLSFIV